MDEYTFIYFYLDCFEKSKMDTHLDAEEGLVTCTISV